MKLELAYLVASQTLRRFAEMLGKLLDGKNVAPSCGGRIVTALKLVQQSLTKWGHRNLLPVTETTAA
jgi:hypothetical protein